MQLGDNRLHCITLMQRIIRSVELDPESDVTASPFVTAELSTDFSISLAQRSRSFGDSKEYLSSSSATPSCSAPAVALVTSRFRSRLRTSSRHWEAIRWSLSSSDWRTFSTWKKNEQNHKATDKFFPPGKNTNKKYSESNDVKKSSTCHCHGHGIYIYRTDMPEVECWH